MQGVKCIFIMHIKYVILSIYQPAEYRVKVINTTTVQDEIVAVSLPKRVWNNVPKWSWYKEMYWIENMILKPWNFLQPVVV